MNGKDTAERAIATAVQALLAIGAVGAAPIVLPGLPAWVGVLAGVVLAVAAAVVKSLGVSAQTAAALSTARQTVDTVVDQVTPAFTNTNVDLAAPGHTQAQTAAPARAAVITPVFDQPTGPSA
jgi:hypothetical protein